MNEAQLELFRARILEVLSANHTPFGLTPEAIQVHLVRFGFGSATVEEVSRELDYLRDKQWAALVTRELNPKNKAWRITADGRDAI